LAAEKDQMQKCGMDAGKRPLAQIAFFGDYILKQLKWGAVNGI
jgi:hypothetical protein